MNKFGRKSSSVPLFHIFVYALVFTHQWNHNILYCRRKSAGSIRNVALWNVTNEYQEIAYLKVLVPSRQRVSIAPAGVRDLVKFFNWRHIKATAHCTLNQRSHSTEYSPMSENCFRCKQYWQVPRSLHCHSPAQNHGHFGTFHGHFPIIDFFTLFHANVNIKNALCKDFIYAVAPKCDARQILSKKLIKSGIFGASGHVFISFIRDF
jgi:hypothetical protein